jgi:hypothetical protein
MTVMTYENWVATFHNNEFHESNTPGPKYVTWKATCVCNPPQYVGSRMMFSTYKNWVTAHAINAQYDHNCCIWYFEHECDAIMFDFTFS